MPRPPRLPSLGARSRRLARTAALRGRAAVTQWLGTAPAASPSRGWRAVHLAVLALLALGAAGTGYLGRLPAADLGPARPVRTLLALNGLLIASATLALYLLERLCAAAYERPLRRAAVAHSWVARHPLLALPVAVLLHLGTGLSLEPLAALRLDSSPGWLRALTGALLVLAALPCWFMLLHPRALLRAAREVRGPRRASARTFWRRLTAPVRAVWQPAMEIRAALRDHRARKVG